MKIKIEISRNYNIAKQKDILFQELMNSIYISVNCNSFRINKIMSN